MENSVSSSRRGTPTNHALIGLVMLLWLQFLPLVASLSSINPGSNSNSKKLDSKHSHYGGGRTAGQADMPGLDDDQVDDGTNRWQPRPLQPSEARLTIVQITDVYTLEHFACLKTMLIETRQKLTAYKAALALEHGQSQNSATIEATTTESTSQGYLTQSDTGVISMLTGDFLAPYLLSSVDRGKGMMQALALTPIDYLTWGNHEADLDHRIVCSHVRNFPGKWINSNMRNHEAMDAQQDYDVVEITAADQSHKRRIGLVGVLSNDPGLYAQFKSPGAFGGATIDDPWETLAKYKQKLEGPDHKCDVVVPLQHLYVPDDHKTCRQFDFPVILSGHDHHRVDQVVDGTRLLKPGLDAIHATVLELSWASPEQVKPTVRARFVKTSDWEADPILDEINDRAYDSLAPLRDTELARVPPAFEPLSSVNSRGSVCSMGRFLCSLLKSSMNTSRRQRALKVDAVLLMGGTIRGNVDYPNGSYFSLEALEAEIRSDETVGVVQMPGWLLAKGVAETHAGDPIPGWMQYDDGVHEDLSQVLPVVTHVNDEPIDADKIYKVATKISDLTNGQSPSWTKYYTQHLEALPPKGAYVNIYAELMAFFSKNMWRKIWEAITPTVIAAERGTEIADLEDVDFSRLDQLCDIDANCLPERRLAVLDRDDTGVISVQEIHAALSDILHLSVDSSGSEMSLAEFVHSFADADGDGLVTIGDMKSFCEEIPEIYDNQKWRLAFPRTENLLKVKQE